MNRTDRLLAIVLELQGKGKQRAEDLARTFETSKRTIYRDIEALCEAGSSTYQDNLNVFLLSILCDAQPAQQKDV